MVATYSLWMLVLYNTITYVVSYLLKFVMFFCILF